jgi:hypothetical protein
LPAITFESMFLNISGAIHNIARSTSIHRVFCRIVVNPNPLNLTCHRLSTRQVSDVRLPCRPRNEWCKYAKPCKHVMSKCLFETISNYRCDIFNNRKYKKCIDSKWSARNNIAETTALTVFPNWQKCWLRVEYNAKK